MATLTHPHIQHLCNIAEQQDVIYVGITQDKNRLVLEQIAEVRFDAAIKYTRGAERVDFPEGGKITFATPATIDAVRGRAADHVFTDDHWLLDNEKMRSTLAPCFKDYERYSVIG